MRIFCIFLNCNKLKLSIKYYDKEFLICNESDLKNVFKKL